MSFSHDPAKNAYNLHNLEQLLFQVRFEILDTKLVGGLNPSEKYESQLG